MVCAKRYFENHKSAIDVNTCVDIIHIAEVFGMPQVSLMSPTPSSVTNIYVELWIRNFKILKSIFLA